MFAENSSLMSKLSNIYEKLKQYKDSDDNEKEQKSLLHTSFILDLADKYNKRLNSKNILTGEGFHQPVIVPDDASEGSQDIITGILRPKHSSRSKSQVKPPYKLSLSLEKLKLNSSNQQFNNKNVENTDDLSSPGVSPIKPLSPPLYELNENNAQSSSETKLQTLHTNKEIGEKQIENVISDVLNDCITTVEKLEPTNK